jgi:aminoglycoside 3-N-acetyltransferase
MSGDRERQAFVPILERAGVHRDGVLVVHSAIATLSRAGFRAEGMIEAFLDYMHGGTVVMPTMTWRTVTPQSPEWDEIGTPSHTGIMTEIFRTQYASHRSIHPTHSVAASGPKAQFLTAGHHFDDTPVSRNSPYGLMRDFDSYVLMIGVGLECCTAIHLPEEEIAPDIYLRPANQAESYTCRDRHGAIHEVRTRRHWRLDRDFPKFGPALERVGLMQGGDLDQCSYQVIALADLLKAVTNALQIDSNATLQR